MAPSEQSAHPKMLLKSPSKPSLAGLSRAKMSKAQLPKGEDFKRNPDSLEPQPARVGGRKGSTGIGAEKNGSCGATATTATMGRAKSRVQLNPESIKVGEHVDDQDGFYNDHTDGNGRCWQIQLHLCSLYQRIKYSRKWVCTDIKMIL